MSATAIYRGDCDLDEVPGGRLQSRQGEADSMTRVYEGKPEGLNNFLTQFAKEDKPDATLPHLLVYGHDVEFSGPLCRVILYFKGKKLATPGGAGDVTEVREDASFEPRNVKLATDNEEDGEISVNYYAPTTVYRYVSKGKFNSPRFSGVSLGTSGAKLLDFNPAEFDGVLQFRSSRVCTGFERSKAGGVYEYKETITVVLHPPGKPPQDIGDT